MKTHGLTTTSRLQLLRPKLDCPQPSDEDERSRLLGDSQNPPHPATTLTLRLTLLIQAPHKEHEKDLPSIGEQFYSIKAASTHGYHHPAYHAEPILNTPLRDS